MDFLLELLAEIAGEVLSVILEFAFKRIKNLKKVKKKKLEKKKLEKKKLKRKA